NRTSSASKIPARKSAEPALGEARWECLRSFRVFRVFRVQSSASVPTNTGLNTEHTEYTEKIFWVRPEKRRTLLTGQAKIDRAAQKRRGKKCPSAKFSL